MQKAFEKILERLEEERECSYADFDKYVSEYSPCLDSEYDDFFHRGLERASRLVKEVAEGFATDTNVGTNGWIPCSERLPEEDGFYLATLDGEIAGEEKPFSGLAEFENGKWVDDDEDYQCIIAWQPIPEPYKESDNNVQM